MLPSSSERPEEPRQTFIEPAVSAGRSPWPTVLAGTFVVIALAGAAFGYYYFFLQKPLPNVSLELKTPETVLLGEPFEAELSYANNSEQPLRNAAVAISLPEGISIAGASSGQRFWEENLGNLEPGAYGKRIIKLIVTNGAQSVKQLEANLRYSVTNDSGSQFRNGAATSIGISNPAIDANITVPTSVMSEQDFSIQINYRNASKGKIEGVRLSFVYPNQFEVREASSTPQISSASDGWDLGAMEPGATGTISMIAAYGGQTGYFSLPAKITARVEGQTYTIWSQTPSVSVSQAPLSLYVLVNDSRNFIAHPGDQLEYKLVYKNNSSVALQNVVIRANPSGTMLELDRLRTGGLFDSVQNTLEWNSTNASDLASVPAGKEGSVSFTVPLKKDYSIRRISDKNFSVKLAASAESPTVPPGVDSPKTISGAQMETKLAGSIALQTLAYYYEPTAGIKNTGPYPPRVNKPTQFTIHWKLKNSSTDMSEVHVSTKLGNGVRFTGKVSPSGEASKPVYNAQTGEVTWDVPLVPATVGTVGAAQEAIFQVEITPAINQQGQLLVLTEESTLKAKDAWTGLTVTDTAENKDTSMTDDPKAGSEGRVKP